MFTSNLKIQISYILVALFVTVIGLLLLNDYLGDPSIYYIYSKNISEGFFLNFNKGEFSSGATSPLWATLLSIPFFFSSNVIYAKLFSLLITLVAHIYFFHSLNKLSKLVSLNVALFLVVSYYTLINGLMSYETSLLLIFVPLLVKGIINQNKVLFYLSVSLLPLVRPDTIVLSLLGFAIYWSINKYNIRNLVYFVISLIPFVIYISYSYIFTGTYSSSSYCRSFALAEDANMLFGIKYSLSTIVAFISFPSAFLIIFHIKKSVSKLDILTVVCLTIYVLVFSFVKPIVSHPERYLAPIFVLLSINVAFKFKSIQELKSKNIKMFLYIVSFMIFAMISIKVLKYYDSYTSKQILEYDLSQELNSIVENSLILTYEVQSRYYIDNRHDIISLDGIIDGKVAPYLESSDMNAFLNEYKPDIWVANDAIEYRKYLRESILHKVYKMPLKLNNKFQIGNIIFELIKENDEDLGKLANWKKIYKLNYIQQ